MPAMPGDEGRDNPRYVVMDGTAVPAGASVASAAVPCGGRAEAAKLTQDLMLRGVIETVVKESQLLRWLPFMEVTGTAVTYNREATMPAASFYDVGDTWSEATPTFTQVTAALKILGGDADVDNFLQATYADPNDVEAEVIASRAKAVAHKFSDCFFHGDSASDAKSFDGLGKAVPSGQTIAVGTNGGGR